MLLNMAAYMYVWLVLQYIHAVISLMQSPAFSSCAHKGWVPFRMDNNPQAEYSFHACYFKENLGTIGWLDAYGKCLAKSRSSVAWWTHWKELKFYYNLFNMADQRSIDAGGQDFFMAFVNLLDEDSYGYQSHYTLYSGFEGAVRKPWNYNRETMIKIQHGRYRRTKQGNSLYHVNMSCMAFKMDKNNFIDSEIDSVPCDAESYQEKAILKNNMQHILCRKERKRCIVPATLGNNMRRIDGIYSYYYSVMRERSQVPDAKYLANVTRCERGCDEVAGNSYYEGDWLVVYCKQGYRVEADIQSQVGYILTCRVPNNAEEPRWTGNSREYDYNKEMCKPIPAGVNDCAPGRGGELCEEDWSPCEWSTCNTGRCITDKTSERGYRCECTGAVGDNCERELNECISGPCSEGSLCIDEHNGYTCLCDALRTGRRCENDIPYCDSVNTEICQNGGDCWSCNLGPFEPWCAERNQTKFICNCVGGWQGQICEQRVQTTQSAWQVFAIVLGCILFIIVSLSCEIVGSRRRHDHDNLQVLLDSIDGYLKLQKDDKPRRPSHKPRRHSSITSATSGAAKSVRRASGVTKKSSTAKIASHVTGGHIVSEPDEKQKGGKAKKD